MKKRIKWLPFLLLSLLLFSCSSQKEISPAEIADSVEASVKEVHFIPSDARYLRANIDLEESLVIRYDAKRCEDASASEFGVFECRDTASAEKLATRIEKRLKDRLEMADNRYFSDEIQNLNNAEVTRRQNYVFYCVLPTPKNQTATQIFINAF